LGFSSIEVSVLLPRHHGANDEPVIFILGLNTAGAIASAFFVVIIWLPATYIG
jgi:hypothetical protein